ncbi:hypothetical protein BD309DRAFT_1017762 [Dichomitus squalens]|nr:hypothetical protein BD309DRAFT_1017762 [Dichomitus squalens]
MDRNNHTNNSGFFRHIYDPQLGHAIGNFVRGLMPQHPPHPSHTHPANQPPPEPSDARQSPDSLPLEPASRPETIEASSGPSPSTSSAFDTPTTTPSPASTSIHHSTHTTDMPPSDTHMPGAVQTQDGNHDVDMSSNWEQGPSQSSQSDPDPLARSTRRARAEDDDDEDQDDPRASNRQRRHAPAQDDDEHHFMPIPEDHGIPPSAPDAHASPPPDSTHQPPQQGSAPPPPPYSRMMWTFEFIPMHGRGPNHNAQAPEGGQSQDEPANGHFFINVPITGEGPAPQPGAAANQGSYSPIFLFSPYFYLPFTDGGNQPGNAGFAFPPFPFPFGMDLLEERDDPERAQRLVEGLEEVPVGLVRRMERAGGPGTDRGQVPTCAVCWESLLDPEGGGFEGNAELAKAEAEAAREDAASQQARESSMEVDDSPSAPVAGSSTASSSEPSKSEATSSPVSVPGELQHPKIVGLPCAHAFHATCLLPWFSKPGRTTCPSCRFDIDPDSLTYQARPLRARHGPQAARAAPGAQPEGVQGGPATQPHVFFGPLPPFFHSAAPPPPPPAPAPPAEAQNASNPPGGAPHTRASPQPGQEQSQNGPQRQSLPPFISFDISMFIPIIPGRAGGAPPPSGAQAASSVPPAGSQGSAPAAPPPPPPRTDNHGFPFDNTVLQEAVRTTFERMLSRGGFPIVPPPGTAAPGDNGQPRADRWFTFSTGPLPAGVPPMPPLNMNIPLPQGAPRRRSNSRRPVEKRQWAPPPAPGPTLRQVVERNERQLGLRCSDVSCGLGPSDDDPVSSVDVSSLRQIAIRPKSDTSGQETVCEHRFHPACLVSAERVAGWGQEVKTGEPAGEDEDVEVSCPVCRAHGVIPRIEWEEGACALA